MPFLPASTALSHIRVVDLTRARSGPTAVRQLADWGADVIKVELPESVEADGALGAKRNTPDFQNLHRNKRSITLNLKAEKGREILLKLVETADVVVENFRPRVKSRLGLDYENLKSVNNRIILASISGFGQTGPYAERPGFDQIAQGMGGLMSITGKPNEGPMRVGIPIADLTSGLFCAIGILTAIIEREKSGNGQWLHTSLLQSQIFMLDFQAARWLMKEEVAPQVGNDHPTSIPTGVFNTEDGEINIACAGQIIWERLCQALSKPQWLNNPKFKDNDCRQKNRNELNAAIETLTLLKSSDEWIEILTNAGVPCGPIYNIDQMFEDPQVKHLAIAQEVDTVPFGRSECIAQPLQLTRTPSKISTGTPTRGEHTDEILEELGFSKSIIDELKSETIV